MKARSYNYFNTETFEIKYGIEVKFKGKWMPASSDMKPLMFETEEERDIEIKRLRKLEDKCN